MILDWKTEENTLLNIKKIIAAAWRMNEPQLCAYYKKLQKNQSRLLQGRLGNSFLQKMNWLTKQEAHTTAKIWKLLMTETDQSLRLIQQYRGREQKAWAAVLQNLEVQEERYFKTEIGITFLLLLKEKLAEAISEQERMECEWILEQNNFLTVSKDERSEQERIARWLMEDTIRQNEIRKRRSLVSERVQNIAVWALALLSVCFMIVWLHGQAGRNGDRWSLQQMKVSAIDRKDVLLGENQKPQQSNVMLHSKKIRRVKAQTEEKIETQEELKKETQQEKLPQYRKMSKKYTQLYGWLQIPGTQIDLPVMRVQGEKDFYLNHDFSGAESSEGALFVDEKSNIYPQDGNTVIYGHNMKNGHMFGTLKMYTDADFCNAHKKICFDTIYETGEYQVVAVLKTRILNENEQGFRYYQFFQYLNKEEFQKCIDFVEEGKIFSTGGSLQYGDKILMLSTCEYSQENGRLVVVAKKISV